MKKYSYLVVILMLSLSANSAYSIEQQIPESVTNVQNTVFQTQSSLMNLVPDEDGTAYNSESGLTEIDPDNMPYFKQMRLRLTNRLLREDSDDDKKFSFRKKKADKNVQSVESKDISETDLTKAIETETSNQISENTLSLEGGVNEQITEKQMTLDADYIDYLDETGDVVATGRPELFLPPQNVRVIADKMVYNEDSNILKGIGHVVILKDGLPTTGEYLEINMNEETMIMDGVQTKTPTMTMDAQKVVQQDGLIVLNNGVLHSEKSRIYNLASRMVGPRFNEMIVDENARSLFFGNPEGNNIKIKIGAIYVEARKNHDVMKAKKITFFHKDRKLFTWPGITAYTNKKRDYFEANYPELGTRRKVGMFIGPGFVFGGPAGSVIKAIPFLNYNHKFGFGGMLKYKNTYNSTELGYGSAADLFFLKGLQRLDDNLFLRYSANSYMEEWFLGARMPKYMAELVFDKTFHNKDFLGDNLDMDFRHRVSFGLMQENDKNYNGENINSGKMSTTRLRYMGEISQSIYKFNNEKERIALDFGVLMQGSAAVYGTGDTQFIARIGPRVHFQYKNWMQDFGYFLSGYSDQTPMPRYDMYRYGHSSVYLTEAIRLNKYLSIGWSGNVNLSDDAPNGKLFQENRFVVAFGPDDFKLSIGYDFVRQNTYFGFNVAFDTKGTKVEYDKMEIKNPERLGQTPKDENGRKLAFSPAQQVNEVPVANKKSKKDDLKPRVLEYAQVIDLEDPKKESVE